MEALDFDDLLTEALKLDPTHRSFTHLLVDEFQDINDTQYALLRAWSRDAESLFVIGDPDQSIYGFRGANGRCFERLAEDFPDTRQIRLTENYRSTPEILSAAAPVIEKNSGSSRRLLPNRPSGIAVRLVQAPDDFAEAVFIAKEIGRIAGGVDMLEAQNFGHERDTRPFSDIAVLCRTHRQLELIEKCLRHDDIPCIVSGREDFLDTDEVRGALAFFRSLHVPCDIAAAETALRLLWDCPADLIQKAKEICRQPKAFEPQTLREAVSGCGTLEAWAKRVEEWLPLISVEKPWTLVERWEEAYGSSQALERLRNTMVFHANLHETWKALCLGEEADLRRAAGAGWESGAVWLMTLHGAKGLEFPAVFVAGVRAGALPLESPANQADLEEERRRLYVGMTRAREELIVTAGAEPSPFLSDLPDSVVRENTVLRRERFAEQLRLF